MAFKDTDKTLFVGRRDDGGLYGLWTVKQWEGQEVIAEDDPEVLAFRSALVARVKARISEGDLAGLLVREGVISQEKVDAAIAAVGV